MVKKNIKLNGESADQTEEKSHQNVRFEPNLYEQLVCSPLSCQDSTNRNGAYNQKNMNLSDCP